MKTKIWLIAAATLLICSRASFAQAPAGSTGQCRDGSYTTAAKKAGACSGHKGVQNWFAGSAPITAAPVPTTAAPAPIRQSASPATAPSHTATLASAPVTPNAPARTQAAGGGAGMVWLNIPSKIYHCPGTEYYGKTKNGKYLSESDAIATGARADHNKPCSK